MSNPLLTDLDYLALCEMRKGLYLLKQGQAQGLCTGSSLVSIKKPVSAGTIDRLEKKGFVRQSMNSKHLFLLTDAGRAHRQD